MDVFASDPMPARHVFKFAISGIALSEEQQRHVSERVARAGVEALASLDLAPHDELILDLPEWLGKWLMMVEQGALDHERVQLRGQEIAAGRERLAGLGNDA